MPAIEPAIETSTNRVKSLPSGNDLSGLLRGAHLDDGDPEILLNLISLFSKFLPGEQQKVFLENLREQTS